MYRIDHESAEDDLFGAGKDGFTEGDPGSGTPATVVTADFMNDVQEELCAIVEQIGGLTLTIGDRDQIVTALRSPIGAAGEPAIHGTGGSSSGPGLKGTGGATNGIGVVGQGTGTGAGLEGNGASSPVATAATTGSGVVGRGGQTNGFGGEFFGKGSGTGVSSTGGTTGAGLTGIGGATSGAGVVGTGTAGNARGGDFTGQGSGNGVRGTGGGSSGTGVVGVGGASNGAGGDFAGTGSGTGCIGTGGSSSGAIGVRGVGGSTNGVGVKAEGVGSGTAMYAVGINGYGVVAESDTTTPTRSALRLVPQDTAPSSTAMGDIFILDKHGQMGVHDGTNFSYAALQRYTMTGTEENSAATTAATNFSEAYTIPAGSLRVGSVIRVRASGALTNNAGGTVDVKIVWGSGDNTIISTATITIVNGFWVLDGEVTVRAIGASGSVRRHGRGSIGATSSPTMTHDSDANATFDLTVARTVHVKYDLSNATDVVSLRTFTVDIT